MEELHYSSVFITRGSLEAANGLLISPGASS